MLTTKSEPKKRVDLVYVGLKRVEAAKKGWEKHRTHLPTPEERFWLKVQKMDGACWIWVGLLDKDGYGKFSLSHRKTVRAHRFSYELLKGPIPEGMVIDHLCRNKACVNPEHMESVTDKVNILRSPITLAAVNSRKTHCPKGHALTENNLVSYALKHGRRACKVCQSEAHERWLERHPDYPEKWFAKHPHYMRDRMRKWRAEAAIKA